MSIQAMSTGRLGSCSGWRLLIAAVAAIGMGARSDAGSATGAVVTIGKEQLRVYPSTLPAGLSLPSPGTTQEGQEYVVVGTAAGAKAVVLVTVEDGPLDRRYGVEKIGKGRQLLVDSDDFPALAASGLHSPAELERTTAITGKPVAEITRVGRPGMASGIGFLAGDEDILSVLRGDNDSWWGGWG